MHRAEFLGVCLFREAEIDGFAIQGTFDLFMGAAQESVNVFVNHGCHKLTYLGGGEQGRNRMNLKHPVAGVLQQKLVDELLAGGRIVGEGFRAFVKLDAFCGRHLAKGVVL